MGWQGTVLRVPISWGDISHATGVGGPPYDLGTMIGNGTSLKKWSLHKPVKLISGYDTPGDISADATWLSYMQNYVAESNSNTPCPFALKVGTSININDVNGVNNAPAVDWVYQRPPASGQFWRRSHDFNKYTSTPNTPLNKPSDFTYYKTGPANILRIDTNDMEAGDTSIQIAQLSILNNYRLMLVVKENSTMWHLCVMSTTIMNAVVQGVIEFTLPSSGLTLSNGEYDAYLVGLTTAGDGGQVPKNAWFTQTSMSGFYDMLPLPFDNKSDCKFRFRVAATAPENIVDIAVLFRINRAMVIQSIEFLASKYGSITDNNSFTLSLYNIDVRNDNDEVVQRLNNTVAINGPWDYSGTTRISTKTVTLNVASYNINAGEYPNIICDTSNNRNYTVNAPFTSNVIFVD